jgi:hypothetical protein
MKVRHIHPTARPALPVRTAGEDLLPALFYVVLGSAMISSAVAHAQGGPARASMERCVDRVLSGLAKSKAPESEVRRAVLSGCDGPLRATLTEAMKSGEARMCASFEACIDLARKQTADEAKEAYRSRVSR